MMPFIQSLLVLTLVKYALFFQDTAQKRFLVTEMAFKDHSVLLAMTPHRLQCRYTNTIYDIYIYITFYYWSRLH